MAMGFNKINKEPATREEAVKQLYEQRDAHKSERPWFLLDDIRWLFNEIFGKDTEYRITDVEFLRYKKTTDYTAQFKYDAFQFKYIRKVGVFSIKRELSILTDGEGFTGGGGRWVKVRTAQDIINLLESREIK